MPFRNSILKLFTLIIGISGPFIIFAQSSSQYFRLGQQQRRNNKHQEAIINYTKAIELDSNNLKAYFFRAESENTLHKYEESIRDYKKVISKDPKYDSWIYYLLANSISSFGLYEDAISYYNKSLEINPKLVCAYNNRGNSKKYLGKTKEAYEDYAIGAAKDQKDHQKYIYVNKASALYDLNRFEEAKQTYQKALQLDPYSYPAFRSRGAKELESLDLDNALNDISIALTLEQPDYDENGKASLHNSRGFIFYLKGYYNEAIIEADSARLLGDSTFMPKYQYRENAIEALKDPSKLSIDQIYWDEPINKVYAIQNEIWKVRTNSDISIQIHNVSINPFNDKQLKLFFINPSTKTKRSIDIATLKEISQIKVGKYYSSIAEAVINIPIGKSQIQFEYNGNITQILTLENAGGNVSQ